MRKILYSPGYGAGWSSWNSGKVAQLMLTYQPIIDAIENGEILTKDHSAVLQLQQEAKDKFGVEYVCVLGAKNLEIYHAEGRVIINDYDGSESVTEEGTDLGWM